MTTHEFPKSASPRRLTRRHGWRESSALVLAVALVATGLAVAPGGTAAAETVGTGACASTVEGLTVTTRSEGPVCAVLVTAGSGTWTVPAGVTTLFVEVLGGGGGGGNFGGGGGGEAVLLSGNFASSVPGFAPNDAPTVSVTPGETFTVSVGEGGSGGNHLTLPTNGDDSVFGTNVAKGGGAGGNYDPVTGVGSAGAAGGTGGGGAPTAVAEENPAVISGAAGGASEASSGGLGYPGGLGLGAKSNINGSLPPSTGAYRTYLVGGGGGGARSDTVNGNINATLSGRYVGGALGDANRLWGGEGGRGVYLGVAEWAADRNPQLWPGPAGFGAGGGGGAAALGSDPATIASAGNTSSGDLYNGGGAENPPPFAINSYDPQTPEANSGQGGGGGGSANGLRFGSDGASGLVAIRWSAGGGAAGAPGAPTGVTGSPGTGQVEVTWTAPDSDGGSAITGYAVEWSTDGGSTWNPASMCSGTATSCTVTGLTDGTGYVFRVSATNANGTGPWSEPSATVTPGTVTPGTVMTPRYTG
jgi:hypothetical protein